MKLPFALGIAPAGIMFKVGHGLAKIGHGATKFCKKKIRGHKSSIK